MSSPIRVGFSTSKRSSIATAVISWFTGSKITHSYFTYFDQTLEKQMVMEAAWNGYRVVPMDFWLKDSVAVAEFSFPGQDLSAGFKWAAGLIGENYGWLKLVGFAVTELGQKIKRKFKNPFTSDRAMVCSEVMVHALQISMIPCVMDLVPEETSPADLFQVLSQDALSRSVF